MTWYKIIEAIPGYEDYEVGQEYAQLPDEVLDDWPECYTISED